MLTKLTKYFHSEAKNQKSNTGKKLFWQWKLKISSNWDHCLSIAHLCPAPCWSVPRSTVCSAWLYQRDRRGTHGRTSVPALVRVWACSTLLQRVGAFKSEMMFELDLRGIFGYHYKSPEDDTACKDRSDSEEHLFYISTHWTGIKDKEDTNRWRQGFRKIHLCAESSADSCH